MIFRSQTHKKKFQEYMYKIDPTYIDDGYTPTMLYLQALLEDIVPHAKMFDLEKRMIIPECLEEAYQTGGTAKLCRFAFNLWNGYSEYSSVYDVFGTDLDPYFAQAIILYRHFSLSKNSLLTK